MKKLLLALQLCCLLAFFALPAPALADMGPKPSVRISFTGLGDEVCWGTLLSEKDDTGPSRAWDGDPEHRELYTLDLETWQAFQDYDDADGYYFLQTGWLVSESGSLDWTYYPPYRFKILLWWPATGDYAVSEVCERYAFDSYFAATLDGHRIASMYESYDLTWEAVSFACRLALTLAIELGLAWCFGFRARRQLKAILVVNLVTQVALNLAINFANFSGGISLFLVVYVALELVVFGVEAAAYSRMLSSTDPEAATKPRVVLYAFVANLASFAAGMALTGVIPGMF